MDLNLEQFVSHTLACIHIHFPPERNLALSELLDLKVSPEKDKGHKFGYILLLLHRIRCFHKPGRRHRFFSFIYIIHVYIVHVQLHHTRKEKTRNNSKQS